MGVGEAKLRMEIAFWRNLVDEWDQRGGMVLTRMQDALAYAELKLELFLAQEGKASGKDQSERRPLQ